MSNRDLRNANRNQEAAELVAAARERILDSPVVGNDWAHDYVNNRPSDIERYARGLELAKRYLAPGAEICDHAAAPFVFPQALSMSGYRVVATDLEPSRFGNLADLDFEILELNVETTSAGDGRFDAIFFSEIFEHCRLDLVTTVRLLRDSLKPGGVLFLSTPNGKSALGLFNFLFRGYAYNSRGTTLYKEWEKLERIGHCGHVREYTAREVRELLTDCGMSVEEVIYSGGDRRRDARIVYSLVPKLRPYFTLVARRTPTG